MNKDIFDQIYLNSTWGYKSGPGSDPDSSETWIDSVNNFIAKDDVSSVLDLGCGDWRLGSKYNLQGKDYIGVDVSSIIINEIKANESDNIKFIDADICTMDIPYADLVLIKDVLQHLPNKDIAIILDQVIKKSKYALICNDFSDDYNLDILPGGGRTLNLSESPFNYNFTTVNSWHIGECYKVIYLHDSVGIDK